MHVWSVKLSTAAPAAGPCRRLGLGPQQHPITSSSSTRRLILSEVPGNFEGPMRQTSRRPCCSYLLRRSGQASATRSFGCLCYQQGRLVRVQGDGVAGTGGRNQFQGPAFYRWIAKGAMCVARRRKVKN